MKRIESTRQYIHRVAPEWLINHLEGVAEASAELARRRGLESELAEIAGLLHDIARSLDPSAQKHGPRGAELAREWLEDSGEFTAEEIEQITTAIHYHSKKRLVHSPFDEVLKDGDVYDHVLSGLFLSKDEDRIRQLIKELR
ncbi:MAG TPA: HD domain-containing protein [Tissierellia bacterium]|nr:HD domain-containing protein [Tissierellia bacterium]